jgi:uncharacterized protein YukE
MTKIEMDTTEARFWSSKMQEYIDNLHGIYLAIADDNGKVALNFECKASTDFQNQLAAIVAEMRTKIDNLRNLKSGLDAAISAHEEVDQKFG